MADDDVRFERKTVRMARGRQDNPIAEWQNDGWEFVSLSQGRRRTIMTFRRVKPASKRRRAALTGSAITLLVVVGIVAATTPLPAKIGETFDRITGTADSDEDGLSDKLETSGWRTQSGSLNRTDPDKADTDGDGLTDGDEAGALVKGNQSENVYSGYSDPLLKDTDSDGLNDAEEADSSLDPLDPDSDDDHLEDAREVEVVGSDPNTADTDGDGFDDAYEDANRDNKGLDALAVDVKVSKSSYVIDFAKGSVLGDLNREDSLAWLAGNLTSGGSSSIPVIGSIVGGITDVRDVIGSAIHGDWMGSSFSAAGAVPGGDVVAIPGKAAKFVARNPELSASVAAIIATLSKVPEKIKVKGVKQVLKSKSAWDELKAGGSSDKALLRLAKRNDLDALANARKRLGHVEGPPGKFFTWREGEKFLEGLYGANRKGATKQVSASTAGCVEVCNVIRRRFDVLIDGIAHESKVGHVRWSKSVERQIRSDAYLIKSGNIEGAYWHFMAHSYNSKVGVDPKVLDLLDELKIPYTIHLPT